MMSWFITSCSSSMVLASGIDRLIPVDQNGRPHTPKEASPKPQPKTLPRASLAHVCWGCVQLSWTQVLKSREKRRLRSGSVWQHPLPLPASPQSRLRYPRQGSARTFGPGCDRPTRLTACPRASARWRKHHAFLFGCFQSFYEFLIIIHSGCWLNHQSSCEALAFHKEICMNDMNNQVSSPFQKWCIQRKNSSKNVSIGEKQQEMK